MHQIYAYPVSYPKSTPPEATKSPTMMAGADEPATLSGLCQPMAMAMASEVGTSIQDYGLCFAPRVDVCCIRLMYFWRSGGGGGGGRLKVEGGMMERARYRIVNRLVVERVRESGGSETGAVGGHGWVIFQVARGGIAADKASVGGQSAGTDSTARGSERGPESPRVPI